MGAEAPVEVGEAAEVVAVVEPAAEAAAGKPGAEEAAVAAVVARPAGAGLRVAAEPGVPAQSVEPSAPPRARRTSGRATWM